MDTDLVVRAQGGDQSAFALLASDVHPRLQQLAYRILRDRELARDAAQQATLSIWRNLPQLRDPARFEAWSYRLCVNACYRESRRRNRSIREIGGDAYREPRAADPFGTIIDRDELERGFQRLSFEHRVVLVLHHYLGLPMDQVAETLDVPLGTVKSRMNRALTNMRRALESDAKPRTWLAQREEVVR